MTELKKTVVAIMLAFPLAASAQSMEAIKAELETLKQQMQQLQSQIKQATTKADAAEAKSADAQTKSDAAIAASNDRSGRFDDETRAEFNRIKVKTEGMEDQLEVAGLKGFKISGYMDPTYIYNQRQQTSSFVFMKNFNDTHTGGTNPPYSYDNGYFGTALVRIEKEQEGGIKWLLELMPHKSYGDGGGYNTGSIVNQAMVTIPLDSLNHRFFAGQVGSFSGYEAEFAAGLVSKKTITNNLLYDFTEASFVTGIGYEHVSGRWDTKAMLGNLNNGRVNDSRSPNFHWRTDYLASEFLDIGFSGIHGRSTATTTLNYLETDISYIRGQTTLQGQLETGYLKGGAYNGGNTQWLGLSTLAAYKFTQRLEGIIRADYVMNNKNGGGTPNLVFSSGCSISDPDGASATDANCGDYRNGFGPGINNATGTITDPNKGANRYALSLGLDYALATNAMLKFELRYDGSTQNTFYDVGSQTYKKNNILFGASTVLSF